MADDKGDNDDDKDAASTTETVIFVVDRSGSIAPRKMDQARGKPQVPSSTIKGDQFNIVAYGQ